MNIKNFYIKYIYGISQAQFPYKIDCSTYFEKNRISILKINDIIQILKDDGAIFEKDNLRYFEIDGFIKIPLNFTIIPSEKSNNALFLLTQEQTNNPNKELFEEIEDFKKVIHNINYEIMELREKVMSYNKNSNDKIKKKVIDLAILYSHPLVKIENGIITRVFEDPIDYEEECDNIKKVLKETNKNINILMAVATKSNLTDIINRSPQIIHLICHGYYSKKKNGVKRFYLCFENDSCELEELDVDSLRNLLKDRLFDNNIKLVFVNACHSEEIANVLFESGISCVIAVQSDLKIEDKAAMKFSEKFFKQIFWFGKNIIDSFKQAKIATQEMHNCFTCCCGHIHLPTCKWKMLAQENPNEAHSFHVSHCRCEKSNQLIHKSICPWVFLF